MLLHLIVVDECARACVVSRDVCVVEEGQEGCVHAMDLPFSQRQSDQGNWRVDMMG